MCRALLRPRPSNSHATPPIATAHFRDCCMLVFESLMQWLKLLDRVLDLLAACKGRRTRIKPCKQYLCPSVTIILPPPWHA